MKRIRLKPEYMDLVATGMKRSTVRAGVRNIDPGAAEIVSGSHAIPVEIMKTVIKRFDELTEQDARTDGFETLDGLAAALRRFYPQIGPADPVSIVYFERVRG